MESERSIRTCNSTGATTELFLCFTSRLSSSSSSSMKISSKSILSPGRPGDQPITLSTSLSRRLRTNGSIKGAQSPMFPNIAGKKRGSAFENPEPSSPKVTCIGQVRVKTKKQGRKMRTLSSRRCTTVGNDAAGGGDVSFRQVGTATDHSRQRNQRWVHLPLTICEALRGIGADLNCLFPCRSSSPSSSCFSGGERNPKSSSCGAVFERWFVTIEGEKGGGREIELVVGEEEDETDKSLRREHPLEKFNEEEDEARVSICIPPKNALLLMRCRSDPVKMAALSTRLFEKEEDIHEEEQEHEEEKEEASENEVSVQDAVAEKTEIMKEDENEGSGYSSEADAELEKLLESEEEVEEDERRKSHDFSLLFSVESNLDDEDEDENEKTEDPLNGVQEPGEASSAAEEIETSTTHEMSESDKEEEEEEREDQRLELSEEKQIPAAEEKKILPDCLLLMMCEPKLSMEVSKETWVCSTDFIRSIPDHRRRPVEKPTIAGVPADQKKRVNKNIPPLPPPPPSQVSAPPRSGSAVLQPPRSSCTLPSTTAMSMAAMIEQKLINAVGYEPFVLTRCKSEPMRTAVAKVTPESCFWKNRKLEPLRRATMGVGAAGIGF